MLRQACGGKKKHAHTYRDEREEKKDLTSTRKPAHNEIYVTNVYINYSSHTVIFESYAHIEMPFF